VSTLRRCPRGARQEVSLVFSKFLEDVVTDNSFDAWASLYLLPFSIFAVPSKEDKIQNLTTWVKDNCSKCSNKSWKDLDLKPRLSLKKLVSSEFNLKSLTKKVEAKISDGDIRRAIRLLNSDDTIAPHDSETLSSLIDKHPDHPAPCNFPSRPDKIQIQPIEESELLKAIFSFFSGSAGGIDSLRPQIWKDLLWKKNGVNRERLIRALTGFINFISEGKIPDKIRPLFLSATLTALRKKRGGIRPVAVENLWRRLIAKIVTHRLNPSLVEYLSPLQLGVGKNGTEAGAHAARLYFNASHSTPKVFLKLDFKNAFNELRRDSMLKEVKSFCPQFFPFISQAYQYDSNLYFGSKFFLSKRGVQQGDPLGPALFALTIHPMILALQSELNVWYLDDGSLADNPEIVLKNLEKIVNIGNSLGLQLHFSKCEMAVLGGNEREETEILKKFSSLAPGIQSINSPDATLLGAPITNDSIRAVLGLKTKQRIT